ncbi:excisionase family DNA binding protein [Nocardia sp. GAS34]|uniref:helix-turn-helix domain-containing protein n=1 Tax=unclassified Nocardia TaxID=2637762 RepID=UPI003D23FD6C
MLAPDNEFSDMTSDVEALLERLQSELTVSVSDAARLLGIGRSTLYTAVKSGEIPAVHVGIRVRIPSIWIRHILQLPVDTE